MKKTLLSASLSALFLSGIFFASCSSEKNVVIEKRHYGNGYYVHVNGKNHADNSVKATLALTTKNASDEGSSVAPKENSIVNAGEINKKEGLANTTLAVPQKANAISAKPNNVASIKNNSTKNDSALIQPTKKAAKSTSGDESAILLIILCLLLPPVAVFLSEGGITTKFWIDLILCLFFWIPGIIFAFIVCFA